MKSKVTTKKGDSGQTSSLNGTFYSKAHPLMECVGTLDELRAHTALLRLQILDAKPKDYEAVARFLMWLIEKFFVIGAMCSDLDKKYIKEEILNSDLDKIEEEQMRLEETIELPGTFILSAEKTIAAEVDVITTISRRFERRLIEVSDLHPELRFDDLLSFVNRLSDYFFILGRYLDAAND